MEPKTRTLDHYATMFDENPTATVGVTLAAEAVYAARHGQFERGVDVQDEWKEIVRALKELYGETLTVAQVRAEMVKAWGATMDKYDPRQPKRFLLALTEAHAELVIEVCGKASRGETMTGLYDDDRQQLAQIAMVVRMGIGGPKVTGP